MPFAKSAKATPTYFRALPGALGAIMVDREARDKSAEILRHFVVGQSFNFDFQDSQPTTKDPVIDAIWDSLWPFYCDVRKHKMKNEWAIPEEGKRKIANWL